MDATSLLREGLLEGRTIALAPAQPPLSATLAALGAREAEVEDGALDALVCDGAALFAAAGGGMAGLRAAVDGCFAATRAAANACFIPAARGKVVLLAPPPDSAEAVAAAAALENTARTLSIEWARFGIVLSAIRPGPQTDPQDVAALTAFLVSPAGDYYSGCAFTLR